VTSRRALVSRGRGGSGTGRGISSWTAVLACVAALALPIPPAAAAAAGRDGSRVRPGGWGPRAGFSSAPDQFVVGLHYDAGEPARRLRFLPNFDVGVGDHRTVVTVNPDLVYSFPVEAAGSIYAGGSCGVVWSNWDGSSTAIDAEGRRMHAHHREADLGVAGIIGYRRRWSGRTVFLDTKICISDAYPGVKLMAGTNFDK
jgi:hypothetical protein